MIQFNLLPDVKLNYIKTQRTKRLVMMISLLAAGVSLALLIILFVSVQVAQKKHMNDLTKDITAQEKKLRNTPDLDKILTIQNQLNSLTKLHADKPVASRLFGYMQQVTPVQANISKLDIDFYANTISLAGTADSLVTANKFADTLKFATYKSAAEDAGKPFTNIVTALSKADTKTTFKFDFTFDPLLFSSEEAPVVTVPKIISTRSETEKPEAIFKSDPAPAKTGGN